GVS
ncbi:hypothetical protein E2320_003925, partial [Naja naja]